MRGTTEDLIAAAARPSRLHIERLGTRFEIPVAPCRDYTALLNDGCVETCGLEAVLRLALRGGRVLLAGPAGSGKTTVMHQLAVLAADNSILPLFIDLSRWSADDAAAFAAAGGDMRAGLDVLLQRSGDTIDLDAADPELPKLLLVDGLNESAGGVPEAILRVVDAAAAYVPACSVIVSDRLVRREASTSPRWSLVRPLPLEEGDVARLMAGRPAPASMRDLLRSPFFLDRAMQEDLRETRVATLLDLVRRHVGNDRAISLVARAAFEAYDIGASRNFDADSFRKTAGQDATTKLLDGGVLVQVDREFAFSHHLMHDCLAARHVTTNPDLLGPDSRRRTLEALTMRQNSFDAVALAFESAPPELVGTMLMAVYDWNPYAVGYAMTSSRAGDLMPKETRWIILAMLADRKFDRQHFTAQRAADALALLPGEDARAFREATSLRILLAFVRKLESGDERFLRWRSLFTTEPGSQAQDAVVSSLADIDSIFGWTASNVLRRQHLSPEQLEAVVRLSRADRAVVRWRSCHVMGASDGPGALEGLLVRLEEDPDDDVRYGAIRSVVEIASRAQSAAAVADRLIALAPCIARSPRVAGELVRAAFPASWTEVPANWTDSMSRIFYAMRDAEDDARKGERWSIEATRLRRHLADCAKAA